MKINLMRIIDHYLGPVFCKLLLALRLFFGPAKCPKKIPSNKDCRNILVIKFFGSGTILLASPALRELKEKYNSASITMFTLPLNRELCRMLPAIDDILYLKTDNILVFLASFMRNLFEIRRRDFDIIINLEFLTNFSALVVLLSTLFGRPRVTVGFSSPFKWRKSVNSINVSFDHSRHISRIYAKMIRSLDCDNLQPSDELSFEEEKRVFLEKKDTQFVRDLIRTKESLTRGRFIVCININAGELSLHRRWPGEYFARIIEQMMKRPDVTILLIGGKQDREYVAEFRKTLPVSSGVIDISGKTDIKQLIALFAEADILITNDSGPLHIAEVVGLPTISFFGPETPYLYGPLDKNDYVFYQNLYCSPCLTIYNSKMSHCRDNICLKSIKPERVFKVIEERYLSKLNEIGNT